MLARPAAFLAGMMAPSPGPRKLLDQWNAFQANATAGNTTLLVADVMNGFLNRTGPAAPFTDTWPDADSVVAAMDNAQKGDSWILLYRNGVAQAMTFAAGTGTVSGVGTLNCAASSTKTYMMTLLATKRTKILAGATTNANAVLTGFNNTDLQYIEQGMGCSGTNVGASAVVLGTTPSDTPGGATITLSVNSTGTIALTALTFFPRYQLDALGVQTN